MENGKTCSHGISPLSINCLLQFPSIYSCKTYEKNLHTPIAQALICSKSHIESTFVLVVHYAFVFSWLTNNEKQYYVPMTKNYFLEISDSS